MKQVDGNADVIFRGGTILTMDDVNPRAEALAIRGERILAVGKLEEVNALSGRSTRVVELEGRTLMPGMIDPHMHTTVVSWDDFEDVRAISTPTFDAVVQKMRDAVAAARPGEWVRAQGYDTTIIEGARVPTLAELDAFAPNNPFFMIEASAHAAYVNSKAYEAAGITRDTPDPPAARYVKDANGELNGKVEEAAAYGAFLAQMPPVTDIPRRICRLLDRAASRGVTAVCDMSVGFGGAGDIALMEDVMKTKPPVRVRGFLVSTAMDEWEQLGLKPGHGDDMFRLIGMKAWSDGATQSHTGYQREDYLDRCGCGALNYSSEELFNALQRAHRAGWQCAVHANGDAGIDTTLAAYEAVLEETPRSDHRHRIEHCSVGQPEHFAKMMALGVSPSFLIGHVRWWGRAFQDRILGPARVRYYDACATALEKGLRISLHSDYNVTDIGPLRCVQDAVTRVMHEGGEVMVPEERIPVAAALKAVTIDAAWQCQMEEIAGSLEKGKFADLAILEDDPTAIDPMKIEDIKVSETWLAGTER